MTHNQVVAGSSLTECRANSNLDWTHRLPTAQVPTTQSSLQMGPEQPSGFYQAGMLHQSSTYEMA